MKAIAFVIPWYGMDISGGAETLCREVVQHLHSKGIQIEVLTTCVKDFLSDWSTDYYKPGEYEVNNIIVKRYPVRKRDVVNFDKVNYKLINNERISSEEERVFFEEMVNSPDLYEYIKDNVGNYHCFVFLPYMFGTTYWGIRACPEKGVILPCIHDESYAYMLSIKRMMESAKGIIFNSAAENRLSNRLYNITNISTVIGMGIDNIDFSQCNESRFRHKHNIYDSFILYAGRKDTGKNVNELIEFFIKYKSNKKDSKIKLVLIGGGVINIPKEYQGEILDLGFVSKEDKVDAYAAASVFCNPSKNESFSIVIMESWMAGTPVIVNSDCEVTKDFCIESQAGLYYNNFEEFEYCIDLLTNDLKLVNRMGFNGKQYVSNNFSWDVIVDKYINFFLNIEQN